MKKVYIAVAMLSVLIVLLLVKSSKDNYYNTMFSKWEAGDLDTEESEDLMNSFIRHLIINPGMPTEEILDLSKQFKVYEFDNDFRIIEYIENPEFYGNSTKNSYHIAIDGGLVKVIDSEGSIRINGFIELENKNYHIFVTDYKFTNITGIDVYSLLLTGKTIEFESIMSKDDLPKGFEYNDSLYYNYGHIYFEGITENNEVFININEEIYGLKQNEDGLYHVIKP